MASKMKESKKKGELHLIPNGPVYWDHVYIGNKTGAEKYGCCATAQTWSRWFVGILCIVVLLIVIPAVYLSYENNLNYTSLQRYKLENADGLVGGMMDFDSSDRTIGWRMYFLGGLTASNTMSTMGIFGPLTAPTGAGPLYLPLCGAPSVYVCYSTAIITSTSPNGYSLSGFIAVIRANPVTYYINVTSSTGVSYILPLGTSAGH